MEKTIKCAQRITNFSSIGLKDRFDKPKFDRDDFLTYLEASSPKLLELLRNIQELDRKDYNKHGKLFKHYIYSSADSGYGSKVIASAFIASGYTLVNKKEGSKIVIDKDLVFSKSDSKFALLSSTALWNTPTTPTTTKQTLKIFNDRPSNIYGDKIRFIILDAGFKEGIDLYDVKYCHIFEEQLNESDLVQAQGRSLRFRGQCGLPFNRGWVLEVFHYKSIFYESKNKPVNLIKYLQDQDLKLKFRLNLIKQLDILIKECSIDNDLFKNINKYQDPSFFRRVIVPISAIGTLAGAGFLAYAAFKKKSPKQLLLTN
jgi:hypothetical protein